MEFRNITRRGLMDTAAAGAMGTLAGIPVPTLGKAGSVLKLTLIFPGINSFRH